MLRVVEETKLVTAGEGDSYELFRNEMVEHLHIRLWMRERKHLLDVIKTAAAVGLGREYIDMMNRYARLLAEGVLSFATELGHDRDDPTVMAAAKRMLVTLDERAAIESRKPMAS